MCQGNTPNPNPNLNSHPNELQLTITKASRPFLSARTYATAEPDLKATLKEVIPAKRELLQKVKAQSDETIGEVKVGNVIGGMRGLKAMLWEGSVLDADEGIRFHGKTIKDCQNELPKGTSGTEMLHVLAPPDRPSSLDLPSPRLFPRTRRKV
jgi:hypothetical protein